MNKVFIFVLGVSVGSLVTWKIVRDKYKKLADEEIESVIETFNKRYEKTPIKSENVDVNEENIEEEQKEYEQKIKEIGYVQPTDELETENEQESYIAPYVISPEEYGEVEGFDTKSWTYWSDFILSDENDILIVNPENIIGDALDHFGEYEDDSVYVRDEKNECDYEILKSEKTFIEQFPTVEDLSGEDN